MNNYFEEAVLMLKNALSNEIIDLEFIKVNQLPKVNGKEVESIHGVEFKDTIYEDDAEYYGVSSEILVGLEPHIDSPRDWDGVNTVVIEGQKK